MLLSEGGVSHATLLEEHVLVGTVIEVLYSQQLDQDLDLAACKLGKRERKAP